MNLTRRMDTGLGKCYIREGIWIVMRGGREGWLPRAGVGAALDKPPPSAASETRGLRLPTASSPISRYFDPRTNLNFLIRQLPVNYYHSSRPLEPFPVIGT